MMAALTGYTPGTFTHFMADTHLYINHLDQVEEQLSREPRELPTLNYYGPATKAYHERLGTEWEGYIPTMDVQGHEVPMASVFDLLRPEHFAFENYNPHPPIKAAMAV